MLIICFGDILLLNFNLCKIEGNSLATKTHILMI